MYDKITILIPCRNEEKFISAIIEDVINQDYPKDKTEVFIIDGMSDDKTREIINQYSTKYSGLKVLDNPQKTVPYAMNIGIKASSGDIIIRMDVHSLYPKDYISKLVYFLEKLNADNVGGVCITKPFSDTLMAKAISLVLAHPFGVGNSYFRIGAKEIKEVDTVPFGCYKRKIFDKIGLFDESLIRNQDDEFNARLKKNGGKIFLIPDIKIIYCARNSLKTLAKMYYQYGYFKPLVNLKIGSPATLRQLVPFGFILSLIFFLILSLFFRPAIWAFIFILFSYLLAQIIVSLKIAIKNDIKLFFILPVAFATLHFSYGIGYINGIKNFVFLKKHKKKQIEDMSLTR